MTDRNTFGTTREILEHCRDLHRFAAERFEALLRTTKDPRARMFLEHLVFRERKRARSLSEGIEGLSPAVLDRYFQFQPTEYAMEALDVAPRADLTVEDVFGAALGFLDEMHDYYAWLGEHAAPGEGQELFGELATFTHRDRRDLSRSVQELEEA